MPQGEISHQKIGEILLEKGFLKEDQLAKALELQRQSNKRLGQTLIFLGLITEDQLAECLAHQLGIPYLAVRSHQIDEDAKKLVSADMARQFGILPLDKIGNILTLAISDGLSEKDIEQLRKATGCRLKFYFITQSDFRAAYTSYYPGENLAA